MKFYNGLPKEMVLEIHNFVMNKRKGGLGQRKLFRLVKEKFGKEIKETTISGWIFRGVIPYANEKTQFKAKPRPPKEELIELYINQKISSEKIAKKYNISTIIVINWLKSYRIKTRTHKESMNTHLIRDELREKRLTRPTKDFSKLISEKAYILGVLCGDAHINKKVIRFEIRYDEEFVKKFSSCFEKVYGIKYNYKYYLPRNSFVLYVASEIICQDLLKYGKFGTWEWGVPKEILNSINSRVICSFLRGFYDSEGSVGRSAITAVSASLKGLKEINLLLKKVCIESRYSLIKNKKYAILYIFRKQRFKLFRDKIGFIIKRKQDRLNEILKNDLFYKPA